MFQTSSRTNEAKVPEPAAPPKVAPAPVAPVAPAAASRAASQAPPAAEVKTTGPAVAPTAAPAATQAAAQAKTSGPAQPTAAQAAAAAVEAKTPAETQGPIAAKQGPDAKVAGPAIAPTAATAAAEAKTAGPAQAAPGKKTDPDAKVEIANPALREKHRDGSVEYKRYEGSAFVNGASPADVIQGSIADCYLMAALSSAASSHAKVLESGIKPTGGGGYEVRFFERQWDGKFKEVWIKVDADLPTKQGAASPAYGRSAETDAKGGAELWPALYEKAYATWRKGYDKMGEGGSSQAALEAVIGAKVGNTDLAWTPADKVWEKLTKAQGQGKLGKAATAGTHGKDRQDLYEGKNLYAWHAYSILGIEEKGGARMVILRNPWGQSEPGKDGKDDGVFKLTLEDFMKYYSNLAMEL